MKLKPFKKTDEPIDPQHTAAWLDWLRDEPLSPPPASAAPPSTSPEPPVLSRVLSDGRSRQYVNTYQPAPRTTHTVAPTSSPVSAFSQSQAPPSPSIPEATPSPTISVQINVPSLHVPQPVIDLITATAKHVLHYAKAGGHLVKTSFRLLSSKKRSVLQTAIVIGLIFGSLAVTKLLVDTKGPAGQTVQTTPSKAVKPVEPSAQPQFKVVIPKSRPELATATAGTAAYDAKRNSYSFSDSFQDRTILVSQQPVPSNFKTDSEALTKIAQQLGTKEVMATSKGPAYLGTDSKSGQQTIVFVTKGVLIFIQSPFSYNALKWQPYLEALEQV